MSIDEISFGFRFVVLALTCMLHAALYAKVWQHDGKVEAKRIKRRCGSRRRPACPPAVRQRVWQRARIRMRMRTVTESDCDELLLTANSCVVLEVLASIGIGRDGCRWSTKEETENETRLKCKPRLQFDWLRAHETNEFSMRIISL